MTHEEYVAVAKIRDALLENAPFSPKPRKDRPPPWERRIEFAYRIYLRYHGRPLPSWPPFTPNGKKEVPKHLI